MSLPGQLARGLVRSLLPALLLWLGVLAPAWALELSAEERAWAASHGPVRVLVGRSMEPFYRADSDGRVRGYAIDVFELLAERAGIRFRYVPVDNTEQGLALLRAGQADMTPFARPGLDREVVVAMAGPVLQVETVLVVRKDATNTALNPGFAGVRVVVVAGSVDDARMQREFPQAQVQRITTNREAMQAVADGRADVMVTELHTAIWFIESQLLGNLQVRRIPGAARDAFGPLVRRDLPQLRSIVAKALDTLTPAERSELARRWLPSGTATRFLAEPALLSSADVYERARQGTLDVVVGMARNPERSDSFHFIGPFASSPTVIVVPRDSSVRMLGDLSDLSDLANLARERTVRVALLRDHFLIPELRSRLPALRLEEHATQEEVLRAVADGSAEAAIGNGYGVGGLLQQQFLGRLRISGMVRDGESELYFGVPRTQPELARLMEKGFAALSLEETTETEQMGALLERTLSSERTLAQGVTPAPQPTLLGSWWRDLMAPLKLRAAEKGLTLQDQPPELATPVMMDTTLLAQVVANVVGNAVKFTPQGAVRVDAQWDAARQRLRINVQDDGPGIAEADRERLFQPYAQGAAGVAVKTGAGLGLVISQRIVQAMGGHIEVLPRPAAGSHFCIDVPLTLVSVVPPGTPVPAHS